MHSSPPATEPPSQPDDAAPSMAAAPAVYQDRIRELEAELAAARLRERQLRAELAALRAHSCGADAELKLIYASRSWTLTQPLRSALDFKRQLPARIAEWRGRLFGTTPKALMQRAALAVLGRLAGQPRLRVFGLALADRFPAIARGAGRPARNGAGAERSGTTVTLPSGCVFSLGGLDAPGLIDTRYPDVDPAAVLARVRGELARVVDQAAADDRKTEPGP